MLTLAVCFSCCYFFHYFTKALFVQLSQPSAFVYSSYLHYIFFPKVFISLLAQFLWYSSSVEHLSLSLYTIASKNGSFCNEISYSNLIVLCFLFSSLINYISCSFVPFHMINMSSIYFKYKRAKSLTHGYICFFSKLCHK